MHGGADIPEDPPGDLSEDPLAEPGSSEDLEQRLGWIPAEDTARGLVFTSLLDTVRPVVDAAAYQRCLAAAGESHLTAFFNYPARALLRLSYAAAWALSEQRGGFTAAMHWLGRRSVPDFLRSPLGTVFCHVTGMDARRLLSWVPIAFQNVYRHGGCELSWTAPQAGRVLLRGALFSPPFIEAAFEQLLEPFQLPGLVMRARRSGPLRAELVFSWERG